LNVQPILPPSPSLADELKKDVWVHIGGVLAIAIGAFDVFYANKLGIATDLIFIIGGFAAQGVKIVNGSANSAATAAVSAINNISAMLAQQQQTAATSAALVVKDTAAATAAALPQAAPATTVKGGDPSVTP
jgi:enoyl-[acyl-carrier-protein] reductase (NADH)